MSSIPFIREGFSPSSVNGVSNLACTEKALIRAAIVAGQGPYKVGRTRAARASAAMRMCAAVASLDTSTPQLLPTSEYLHPGSTEKAAKSFCVGNTLCSHSTLMKLRIPWLVDIENDDLMAGYVPKKLSGTRKRPDFIGQNDKGQWFVFESKGRNTQPNPKMMLEWEEQAKAITHINNIPVAHNIISATYLNDNKEWELKWVDVSPNLALGDLFFEESSFFTAYYAPIVELIESESKTIQSKGGVLSYIPTLDAYVGIHNRVLSAIRKKSFEVIKEFARENKESRVEFVNDLEVSTFADGILIALGKELT
jgi:hypothetical protein